MSSRDLDSLWLAGSQHAIHHLVDPRPGGERLAGRQPERPRWDALAEQVIAVHEDVRDARKEADGLGNVMEHGPYSSSSTGGIKALGGVPAPEQMMMPVPFDNGMSQASDDGIGTST